MRVFSALLCVSTLFFHGGFLRDEERNLGFRIGGYFVMIHAFIGGFRSGPDVTWIETGSLFIGLVILVWTVDLADFRPSLQDFLCLIFSCINIVYSSFYRMHVLIQFVLLF